MPNDLNVVSLIGRLTKDPELKATGGGTSVCQMRLAVNRGRKDSSGVWQEHAHFFDVNCFGSIADSTARYMAKGSQVCIQGALEFHEWEAKDGGKRSRVVVVANQVQFLGSKNGGDPDSVPRSDVPASGVDEDEIPF